MYTQRKVQPHAWHGGVDHCCCQLGTRDGHRFGLDLELRLLDTTIALAESICFTLLLTASASGQGEVQVLYLTGHSLPDCALQQQQHAEIARLEVVLLEGNPLTCNA